MQRPETTLVLVDLGDDFCGIGTNAVRGSATSEMRAVDSRFRIELRFT